MAPLPSIHRSTGPSHSWIIHVISLSIKFFFWNLGRPILWQKSAAEFEWHNFNLSIANWKISETYLGRTLFCIFFLAEYSRINEGIVLYRRLVRGACHSIPFREKPCPSDQILTRHSFTFTHCLLRWINSQRWCFSLDDIGKPSKSLLCRVSSCKCVRHS